MLRWTAGGAAGVEPVAAEEGAAGAAAADVGAPRPVARGGGDVGPAAVLRWTAGDAAGAGPGLDDDVGAPRPGALAARGAAGLAGADGVPGGGETGSAEVGWFAADLGASRLVAGVAGVADAVVLRWTAGGTAGVGPVPAGAEAAGRPGVVGVVAAGGADAAAPDAEGAAGAVALR